MRPNASGDARQGGGAIHGAVVIGVFLLAACMHVVTCVFVLLAILERF